MNGDYAVQDSSENLVYHVPSFLTKVSVEYNRTAILLLYYIAAMVKDNEKTYDQYIFDIKVFKDAIGSNSNAIYEQVREAVEIIQANKMRLKTPKGILQSAIISHAYTNPNSGIIEMTLDKEIKPYFYELKQQIGYTSGLFDILPAMRKPASIRLYLLLKSWQFTKKSLNMSIEAVHEFLNTTDKYSRFYDFEKYVLKAAVDEINAIDKDGQKKTDMTVSYKKIKKGRSVAFIEFLFEVDSKRLLDNPIYQDAGRSHWIEQVRSKIDFIEDLTDNQVYELYMIANEETTNKHVDILSYMFKNHYVVAKQYDTIKTNYFSFYKAALKNNYAIA